MEKEDLSIFAQSSRFRIVTAERYAASLWEALALLGGFRRREDVDIPNEERQELLTREEKNSWTGKLEEQEKGENLLRAAARTGMTPQGHYVEFGQKRMWWMKRKMKEMMKKVKM